MVLDYSSLGSLGKRTKTGWGARRIGGRVDCGRQREEEGSRGQWRDNGEKTQGIMGVGPFKGGSTEEEEVDGVRGAELRVSCRPT